MNTKEGQITSRKMNPFWLSLALAIQVFILVPGNLYLGNMNEFVTLLTALARAYAIPAVYLILITTGFSLIVPARKTYLYVALLVATFLMIWAQANLLVWELGLLDGKTIEWERFTSRNWIDSAIWLTTGLLACRYARQIAAKGVFVVYLFCPLQCIALLIAITNSDYSLDRKSHVAIATTPSDTMYRFSKENNVLLIVMDGFQPDVFDYIIREPRHGPFLQRALQGFVYYRDNMGVFPTTYMSVPALAGEQIYANHMPQREFVSQTMASSSILKVAHDAGYLVDLAAPVKVLSHYIDAPHSTAFAINYDETGTMSRYRDAARLLDISLFRIAPHFLKQWIYNEQKWRIEPLIAGSGSHQFHFFLVGSIDRGNGHEPIG